MKCKHCGSEIPKEPKGKWIKFKNLGIEVNSNQVQNRTKFKDIKIPKGCRLLRFEELKEVMNYIIKNKLDIWSYFEQPIESFKNKYVARFDADSDWASLYCCGDPEGSDASLGVIFCRKIKGVDKNE